MIHVLLFTFSENHKTELFRVLFTKEDDGKAARWLHSNVKSLYFVIKSFVL